MRYSVNERDVKAAAYDELKAIIRNPHMYDDKECLMSLLATVADTEKALNVIHTFGTKATTVA